MKKKKPGNPKVTDAELSVLEVLWDDGAQSIRRITSRLYRDGTTSDYATVQKLLERLEGKGCVRRDRRSFAHTFTAVVEREDLIGQQLEDVAKKLCNGSVTPLLVHLLSSGRLEARDREMLRRLLEDDERR